MRVDDWRMPVTSPKEDCAAGGANTIVACWRMPVVSTLFTICIGCEVPLVAAATNSQFKRLYIASVKSPILRGRTFHPQIHNKRQVQRRIRISKMYKHTHKVDGSLFDFVVLTALQNHRRQCSEPCFYVFLCPFLWVCYCCVLPVCLLHFLHVFVPPIGRPITPSSWPLECSEDPGRLQRHVFAHHTSCLIIRILFHTCSTYPNM